MIIANIKQIKPGDKIIIQIDNDNVSVQHVKKIFVDKNEIMTEESQPYAILIDPLHIPVLTNIYV